MIFITFSHHVREETHKESIEAFVGQAISAFIDISDVHFDASLPFQPQVEALMARVDFPLIERALAQGEGALVYLPSLHYIAALIVTAYHGRMGHFPSILRSRPLLKDNMTTYVFDEVIDLNLVRENFRKQNLI
jgi:hypothetical protein